VHSLTEVIERSENPPDDAPAQESEKSGCSKCGGDESGYQGFGRAPKSVERCRDEHVDIVRRGHAANAPVPPTDGGGVAFARVALRDGQETSDVGCGEKATVRMDRDLPTERGLLVQFIANGSLELGEP